LTEILSVGVEGQVMPMQKILSTGGVSSMISPEKLDYFKWQIPDGSRVRLTLIQKNDLEFVYQWKSEVDISYITSKAIQPISLEERHRRFKEGIPSVFAIRRITDNQFIGEISV